MTSTQINQNPNKQWVTDGAWITGIIGAFCFLISGWLFYSFNIHKTGISLFQHKLTEAGHVNTLVALTLCGFIMLAAETIRLYLFNPKDYWKISPKIREKKYLEFFRECLWDYIALLIIIRLITIFYHYAPVYGYFGTSIYYESWFSFIRHLLVAFACVGFIYIPLTRAFKHDEEKDSKSYGKLLRKLIEILAAKISKDNTSAQLNRADKKTALGLLVRVFFAPLMTVFFVENFANLISNFNYLFESLPTLISDGEYTHKQFNNDLSNIGKTLFFTVDVGLGWCGYVLTSRWVDNETKSTDTSLLGWVVCVICYPPLKVAGHFFIFQSENSILSIDNQWLATFFIVLMLVSFTIYVWSTIVFGVRFSNLTNRGIIRTGPFSIIRHPAYASKNFAWWLLVFPTIVYLFTTGKMTLPIAIASTLGLCINTYWYYLRAMTEEKHLLEDPVYQQYCKKVTHRFIPRVL